MWRYIYNNKKGSGIQWSVWCNPNSKLVSEMNEVLQLLYTKEDWKMHSSTHTSPTPTIQQDNKQETKTIVHALIGSINIVRKRFLSFIKSM